MVIKVLHVVSALDSGGVERMLLNYLRALDRQLVTFDFAVHGGKAGQLEDDFRELGSSIHHLIPKRESMARNVRQMCHVIREGRYDVVHAHQNLSNFVPLAIAKLHRVPIRISHGHGYNSFGTGVDSLVRAASIRSANYYFACTETVGQWLHGPRWNMSANSSFLMRNAIDVSQFKFDPIARSTVRRQLNVGSRPLLLQIGRLSPEKNPGFALQVLDGLIRVGFDCVLAIAGSGDLEGALRQEVVDRGLGRNVRMLGFQRDVSSLMSAADVLLIPSVTEGLGMVAIEAQASGLRVVASEGVPLDVRITDLVEFESLSSPVNWVDAVRRAQLHGRTSRGIELAVRGYEITSAVETYSRFLRDAYGASAPGIK